MIINRGRKWYQSIGLPLKVHWHEILGTVFVCEIEPNRFLEYVQYVYKTVSISFAISPRYSKFRTRNSTMRLLRVRYVPKKIGQIFFLDLVGIEKSKIFFQKCVPLKSAEIFKCKCTAVLAYTQYSISQAKRTLNTKSA